MAARQTLHHEMLLFLDVDPVMPEAVMARWDEEFLAALRATPEEREP